LDPTFTETKTFGHRVASRAINFLEETREEDFFLVISFDEPHDPYLCPFKYVAKHLPSGYKIPSTLKENLSSKPLQHKLWAEGESMGPAMLKILTAIYYGCNSFVDAQIGRILEAINSWVPEALVIYTADHGDSLGSHGFISKGPAMYEEITNIPYLVRWPGKTSQNTVSNSLMSHIDLTPTVLDYFSLTIPRTLEGISALEIYKNPEAEVNDAVYMEFGRYEIDQDGFGGFQPIRCIYDGRYKLVINLLSTDEFYDLKTDPLEENNLIDSTASPSERDRLHGKLLDWMNKTRDPFRGYQWENRPWKANAAKPSWNNGGITRQKYPDQGERIQLDYSTGLEVTKFIRKKGNDSRSW